MRILFLFPNISSLMGNLPYGVGLLTAILRLRGYQVSLFDTSFYFQYPYPTLGTGRIKEKLSEDIYRYRDEGDRTKIIISGYLKCRQQSIEDFKKKVAEFKPDIIAISTMTPSFELGMLHYRGLSEPRPVLVVGGVHPIVEPEKVLSCPEVKAICIGDGGTTILPLVEAIAGNKDWNEVPNIIYRDGKSFITTSKAYMDMEKEPIPDFTDFQDKHFDVVFKGKNYRRLRIETSRGCPYSCNFCSSETIRRSFVGKEWKRTLRMSVEKAIEHIRILIKRHNLNFLALTDENFFCAPKEWLQKFADFYTEEINLPSMVMTNAKMVTENNVKLLKRINCLSMSIGLESGNEEYRKKYLNKIDSDTDFIRAIQLLKEYDVRCQMLIMIGLPNQTREIIDDTIKLLRKMPSVAIAVNYYDPLPGCKIYDECKNKKLVHDLTDIEHYLALGRPIFDFGFLSKSELAGIMRTMFLYSKVPEQLFPEVKKCEAEIPAADKLLLILNREYAF